MMKKTLAILLVIAMLLVMLPTMALAASTITVRNSTELDAALTGGAASGDTIFLYNGDYLLNQTTLNMDLTIVGESEDGVVLFPTGDTGSYSTSGGDTSGWLFLQTGSLSISNLTMDGTGFAIAQALRTKGALTVQNITIQNIEYSQYIGFGIGVYQPGSLVAANVTMNNIARVGIHAKGDTDLDGFSYTGKGAITCLDYAMEIGTFNGSMTPFTVNVTNASITDCLGVADDSAKSGSAALYINTYFYQADGGLTSLITVNISNCTVSNSSVGLYVGYYDKGEYSDTVIGDTNFINCDTDIVYSGLAGTSSVTTNGNYYGGGAPTLSLNYGNVVTNIDSYVSMPIATTEDTDVTAGVDPAFMIIIPAAVDFGALQKNTGFVAQSFPVEAVDVVIEAGYEIDVSVTSPFVMKDMDGAGSVELPYALFNEATTNILTGQTFAAFVADRVEAGAVQVDTSLILSPGSYKGTMDFTIAYQAIP